MTRAAKRSRTARQPLPSKSPIDNLSDLLLVEVLCRLPDNKVVSQCKRVSKRWCTLLSDPYFVGRFLCLQRDQQKPHLNAYAMIPDSDRARRHMTSVLTMSSQPPYSVVDTKKSIFSFLPCFQDQSYANREDELEVAGTYNDLVLCSPTEVAQRDYYICNFFTKEWIRLPPTPRVIKSGLVPVGFICDPYYSIKEDGSNSSTIKLNAEYRSKVVRLLPKYLPNSRDKKGFSVEIYSSETGEWREYQLSKVLNSQQNYISFTDWRRRCTGVACNGKLYWWNHHGFIFELDPFNIRSTGNIIDTCRFIGAPALHRFKAEYRHIGVCQGRLRMCPSWFNVTDKVIIWELRENQVDGKPEWCLICDGVSLSQMVHKQPLVLDRKKLCISQVVGFHPSDGDILYLQLPGYTVMCNVLEKTLEMATKNPFHDNEWSYKSYKSHRESYPLVFPWWLTPVQRRLDYREEYFNITVTGKYNITVGVGCLTTLKQLKKMLGEDELYFNELLLEKDGDDMQLTLLGIGEDSEIRIVEDCWRKPARRKRKRKRIAQR